MKYNNWRYGLLCLKNVEFTVEEAKSPVKTSLQKSISKEKLQLSTQNFSGVKERSAGKALDKQPSELNGFMDGVDPAKT